MTRLLMEHGADARIGIWPYRKETQAIALAAECGYDEIVATIQEAKLHRKKAERGSLELTPRSIGQVPRSFGVTPAGYWHGTRKVT